MWWERALTIAAVVIFSLSELWKFFRFRQQIAEDHKRVTALWRDHGYNAWDGCERRRQNRQA